MTNKKSVGYATSHTYLQIFLWNCSNQIPSLQLAYSISPKALRMHRGIVVVPLSSRDLA